MFKHYHSIFTLFFVLFTSLSLLVNSTQACTRILNATNGQAVLVGRTMDWHEDIHTNLMVYPRGIERNGMTETNPLRWTSKYGNIVTTSYDFITTDGMNERGLAAHMLWLSEADYGARDDKVAGLSTALWVQFYIDNFSTVDEAIRYTEKHSFQLARLLGPNTRNGLTLHLAIEDATGDSAILEYIHHGELHIYHDRNYVVMSNSPTFDQQLKIMKEYKVFGGTKPLPGSTDSTDRFVRSAYYSTHLPNAKSLPEAITGMLSVVQNIAEPFSTPDVNEEIEPTLWRVVSDLSNKVYYFNDSSNLSFIWIRLDHFNLQPGSPTMKLDLVNSHDLSGDVSNHFKPVN